LGVVDLFVNMQTFQISSGYGLFRRMTGVGALTKEYRDRPNVQEWGGLPPSLVLVPGIIVEGSVDMNKWELIPFRYTMGDPQLAPRRTAPMQPRLDWRMWFASMGSYQSDPWLIHLLVKLLQRSEPILDLLDPERDPFSDDRPPKFIRCQLHHWDFTRTNSSWARANPNALIISSLDDNRWYTHEYVSDYTPVLTLPNPSIVEFLTAQGWSTDTNPFVKGQLKNSHEAVLAGRCKKQNKAMQKRKRIMMKNREGEIADEQLMEKVCIRLSSKF
jgi:hypothetical protein